VPKLDTATQSATKLPIDVTHSLVRAPMRCLTASTETDSTSLKLHPKYRGTCVCVCDSIILPISSEARGVPYSTTCEGIYVSSTQLNYSPKRNLKDLK